MLIMTLYLAFKKLQDNVHVITFLFVTCNVFHFKKKCAIIIYASVANAPNRVGVIVRLLGQTNEKSVH